MHRRISLVAAAAMGVLLLSACQPIVYDVEDGLVVSSAQRRVADHEVGGGPGLDIRMRGCNTVTITDGGDPPKPLTYGKLRPIAKVTDASGKVFYNTMGFAGYWVEPAGARVVDTQDDGDVDHVFVPVKGAKAPLTIESGCTNYAGYGSGGGFTWTFPPCKTSTRSCPGVQGGTPTLSFGLP